MSLKKIKELNIGTILPSNMTFTLADSSVTRLLGIIQNMLVHVDGLTFPTEFMVIDMKGDSGGQLFLGAHSWQPGWQK